MLIYKFCKYASKLAVLWKGMVIVMLNEFSRTELLLGSDAMHSLADARIIVFGVGGVGGYVVEALARCGVGTLDIVDDDKVCLTNINRQIIATRDTVGKYKVDVMKDRILSINPKAQVNTYKCFYLPEESKARAEFADANQKFDFSQYTYVVDAIDTISAKIDLIVQAQKVGTPIISCLGVGNKLNPTELRIADIYRTTMCPLAKVMRRELKKRGIKKQKVLFSTEKPLVPIDDAANSCRENCVCPPGAEHKCTERRAIPGSVSFVPSVAGLIIASEVVKDIVGIQA